MEFLGYVYDAFGRFESPQVLEDEVALVKFINENLEAEQMVVTDLDDNQLLLTREGVDFFSDLSKLGIELGDVYRQVWGEQKRSPKEAGRKPEWEVFYDSIGLTPAEIRERQKIKEDCLAAETVADVAALIRGSYFRVYFYNQGHDKCWGHLDQNTLAVELLLMDGNGYWYNTGSRVILEPDIKVRHLCSGEEIHEFLLFDMPEK